MGTTLDNGIYLPDEGERNCYDGLAGNWVALDNHLGSTDIHVTINDKQAWNGHIADTTIHVTSADKQAWNGHIADTTIHVTSADKQAWDSHVADTTIHVTSADKQAWNGHIADSVKHVTAEDKEAWNGKADASALTAHTGDTTIHVTAEDKAKWDAVTSKADDADVLHKTGDEASTGKKTFGDMATFKGSYLGTEVSSNARTVMVLESNRDTSGQSGLYITKFRQNKAQGSMTGNDVVYIAFDVLENSVRTDRALRASFTQFVNDKPTKVIFYSDVSGDRCLGVDTNKWTEINGLEPSALGMPDLSKGIDISSYLTNAGTVTPSEYTPSVNGYICVQISADSPPFIRMYNDYGFDNAAYTERNETGSTSGGTYTRFASLIFPANKDVKVYINIMPSTSGIISAKFYPCQGNV